MTIMGSYAIFWRKMESTSVWAERMQKPLIYRKSQHLFDCTGNFQSNLQLHVVLKAQNECNVRLNWKASESSHTLEITLFVQLHMWFSKQLTASGGALSAKWRQHPSELKGCWRFSNAWNHNICSAAHVIFKTTYSFMWCSRYKMKATSVWGERLQKPLIRMKSQYLLGCTCDF